MKFRSIGLKRILGVGAVVSSLLLSSAPGVSAGVWNLREYFAEAEVTTEEIEQLLLRAAQTATPDNPVSYLTEVYEAIFEPQAVKIPFRYTKETGQGKEILQSGTMYYSQGDLFILNETTNGADWNTNFATIDGELYTWASGENTGLQLTRFQGDTIELLDYWIDPAMLMRFTYLDYQQKPEDFEVIAQGDELYLQRKEAPHGFIGIRVEETPHHWMSALITANCSAEICPKTEDAFSIEIDRPVPIQEIPAEVKVLPSDVVFEPSERTADSYMTYL